MFPDRFLRTFIMRLKYNHPLFPSLYIKTSATRERVFRQVSFVKCFLSSIFCQVFFVKSFLSSLSRQAFVSHSLFIRRSFVNSICRLITVFRISMLTTRVSDSNSATVLSFILTSIHCCKRCHWSNWSHKTIRTYIR